MSISLIGVYVDIEARQRFEAEYRATGKRYDVGKSCVRFKRLDDLPLTLVGESVALFSVNAFIEQVEKIRPPRKSKQN